MLYQPKPVLCDIYLLAFSSCPSSPAPCSLHPHPGRTFQQGGRALEQGQPEGPCLGPPKPWMLLFPAPGHPGVGLGDGQSSLQPSPGILQPTPHSPVPSFPVPTPLSCSWGLSLSLSLPFPHSCPRPHPCPPDISATTLVTSPAPAG